LYLPHKVYPLEGQTPCTMQTIEISDKLYKEILAHRQGDEPISKVIERKFKQEEPEKKSKALQEIDEIRKGKFYTRTQVEKALKD